MYVKLNVYRLTRFILLTACLLFLLSKNGNSQSLIVDTIAIQGNKQTKRHIILREFFFKQGDTIQDKVLDSLLTRTEELLINTRLFNETNLTYMYLDGNEIRVQLTVKERWYTWPAPVFNLIDRNPTHWWVNENGDLSRVEYGLRFYRFNMRGRNERLRLKFQGGFTQTLGFEYRIPYVTKNQRLGIELDVEYMANRTLIYKNQEHIQQNLFSDEILYRRFYSYLTFTYRPSYNTFHRLNLGYNRKSIADTVAASNPDFFLNGNTQQNYPFLSYSIRHDTRDYLYYPLNGYRYIAYIEHAGLGLSNFNRTELFFSFSTYKPLFGGQKLFYAGVGTLQFSFPAEQPYPQFQAMGFFENYVRGFERYVVEGQHYGLTRQTLRWKFIDHLFNLGNMMPVRQFREIPLGIYLKVFTDAGVVSRSNPLPDNFLVNEPLGSIGIGIDITTYYDIVVRFEATRTSENLNLFAINIGADII